MLNPSQEKFLKDACASAKAAGHIFPEMAACEAALESTWGVSRLARDAHNLFGRKASHDFMGPTVSLPTEEFIHGEWVTIAAEWIKFPGVEDCFKDRMALLARLSPEYPHYASALAATDPETFVTEVSKSWSTDPKRASKVISIYRAHKDILE